jgi:hypothetical protein
LAALKLAVVPPTHSTTGGAESTGPKSLVDTIIGTQREATELTAHVSHSLTRLKKDLRAVKRSVLPSRSSRSRSSLAETVVIIHDNVEKLSRVPETINTMDESLSDMQADIQAITCSVSPPSDSAADDNSFPQPTLMQAVLAIQTGVADLSQVPEDVAALRSTVEESVVGDGISTPKRPIMDVVCSVEERLKSLALTPRSGKSRVHFQLPTTNHA